MAENSLKYRPDIQGMRALAILLVIAYHVGARGFGGGFVGVDMFFVLSGYLITELLVEELDNTGDVNFINFYLRRAKRLAPAFCVVLIVTMVFSWVVYAPSEQVTLAGIAASAAAYLSNVWFAREATDYLAADMQANPFLHTWSLAVEEQFYLIWPWMVFVFLRKHRSAYKTLSVAIALLLIVSFILGVLLTRIVQPWAFFFSPARAWEFALGALAMLLPIYHSEKFGIFNDVYGWLGLALIAACVTTYSNRTTFPGVAALVPCVGTIIMLRNGKCSPLSLSAKFLGGSAMQWIGNRSYSWYLWHWPVLVIAAVFQGDLDTLHRLGCIVLSLLLAAATFEVVENPIRKSKVFNGQPVMLLTGLWALAGSVVLVAFLWKHLAISSAQVPAQQLYTRTKQELPKVYRSGCHLGILDTSTPECLFGAPGAQRLAVLFGDSHAAQWFPALDEAAQAAHFSLLSVTKSECLAPSVQFKSLRLGRDYLECDEWRSAMLSRIVSLRPKIVFIASSYQYGTSSEDWATGLRVTLSKLAESGARVVLLRDTPHFSVDIPGCLARADWTNSLRSKAKCSFKPNQESIQPIYEAELRVAEQANNVKFVDLTASICGVSLCEPIINGVVKFRDSNHLSVTFARQFAPVFVSLLQDTPVALSPST